MCQIVPTDFDTTNHQESIVNIVTSFIADAKTAILVQPRKSTLNNPPINPQTTAVIGTPLSQHGLDAPLAKFLAVWFAIISSITQHRSRTPKWPADLARNSRNLLDQRQQLGDIMAVGAGQSHRQRDPIGVGHHMVFRALLAAIRGVWACFGPPKTARTEAESTTAREKSIWSACRNWLSNTRWILSHTPAFCQSLRRRQQVMPEPQPISWGRSSQAMPVLSTKRIPVRAARSGKGFRPGYRNRRFFFGSNGSMICHNSSSSIGFAMSSLLALIARTQLLMVSVKNTSFC